jgi:TRAP-type C4-dicarboxylate transport system permease small subunit
VKPPSGGDGSTGDRPDESAKPPTDEPGDEPASSLVLPVAQLTDAEGSGGTAGPLGSMTRGAFPDDGPLARWVRTVDRALGNLEQAVLFLLLGAVVLTAAAAALSDRVLGHHLGRWWFDIVRGGTFSVAMIGAVYATHQQRHLSMDLVSRRLPARGRLFLRVVLALFTVLIAGLLVQSGLHQLDTVGEEGGDHFISTHSIVMFMPLGASLIIVHTVLHMVIDIDYIVRRKLPPERMRSGH